MKLNSLVKGIIAAIIFTLGSLSFAAPVNINTADAKSLAENIKGVGAKKAEAIVHYRNAYGPFKTIGDLAKVKGIGNKTVDKNKDIIFLDDSKLKPTKNHKK